MNLSEYKKCLNDIRQDDLDVLKGIIDSSKKIIILGNGGSNAISGHISEDYTKALGKRAICFGDSARMSCYANDYGWENAYTKFIEHFADPDTLIILISSSGGSKNILNAAHYCVGKHEMITMSGFSSTNNLKFFYEKHSSMHFWINSEDYGIIEILHELILHSVI